MEALKALLDNLNTDYPGATHPSTENAALLQRADQAAEAVGYQVWLGDDDRWYAADSKLYPRGKVTGAETDKILA